MMSRDKNAPRMVHPVNDLHEDFHVQILECHIESALFAVDDLAASVVYIGRARERHTNLFVRAQTHAHILLKLATESQKTMIAHIAAKFQNGRICCVRCLCKLAQCLEACLIRMLQAVVCDPFLDGADFRISGTDRFHNIHAVTPLQFRHSWRLRQKF